MFKLDMDSESDQKLSSDSGSIRLSPDLEVKSYEALRVPRRWLNNNSNKYCLSLRIVHLKHLMILDHIQSNYKLNWLKTLLSFILLIINSLI